MKLNKFFLFSAAVGLALASCSDDVAVTSPDNGKVTKGNTYVAVSVTQTQTRASSEELTDKYAGTDTETKVANIYFLKGGEAQVEFNNPLSTAATADNKNPDFWKKEDSGYTYWKTGVFETDATPTPVDMNVILNGNDLTKTAKASDIDPVVDMAGTNNAGDVVKNTNLFMANGFTMTSATAKHAVAADVTKEQAFAEQDPKNNFDFDVTRLLVKGIVVDNKPTNDYEVKDKADVALGKVSKTGMTFAGVNGATKSYLFNNKPTESAIHKANAASTAAAAKTEGLVRLGNLTDQDPDPKKMNFGSYTAVAVNEGVDDFAGAKADALGSKANAVYFFENTSNDYSATMAKVGYNRYAYAKVYVTFVPNDANVRNIKVMDAETNGYKKFKDHAGADKWGMWDTDYKYSTASDKTFFYAEGYLFGSVDAALFAGYTRDQIYTYKDGRMAYRSLWNRVETSGSDKNIKDAGTYRNNIYVLEITGFTGLGMPWDPADPNDPNLPQDPDDNGTTPPGTDPDVNPKAKSFMRVNAKVIPWTVYRRSVNFGGEY
ncbi:Mfa1 family fimbria major subunit [Bacteroides sp. Marseille-P3684]|uniref:Mfa1 family fimbria major subunit n=1 Tax=Bacteroides sp. Marseille-P3684 TaxID=2086579 RepID=UPI00130072D8|nr:Mfa1 family fimbria major subunit [Bacteroides sp. Marseille-P3684]